MVISSQDLNTNILSRKSQESTTGKGIWKMEQLEKTATDMLFIQNGWRFQLQVWFACETATFELSDEVFCLSVCKHFLIISSKTTGQIFFETCPKYFSKYLNVQVAKNNLVHKR